jgi:hypothetical protein
MVYIFVDDFQDTEKILDFLMNCWRMRSMSSVVSKCLPRIILVCGEPKSGSQDQLDTQSVFRRLSILGCKNVSEAFLDISYINIGDSCLSAPARYEPIRALVAS